MDPLLRAARIASLACTLFGCGVSASPVRSTAPREPAPARATSEPPGRAGLDDIERALLASLEPRERAAEAPSRMGDVLDDCAGEYDECSIASRAAFDARSGAWVILSVDYSEGGAERAALREVTASAERTVVSVDTSAEGIAALRGALRPYAALTSPEDLVREVAPAEFSLNTYAPLVTLGAPLEGWALRIETTDLDSSEHVVTLVRRDGSERHVLGRRPAEQGACDGGGWFCERVPEDECTAARLRAEGRLCVQPLGVEWAGVSPDRATLAILGFEQVAGHGGAPSFAWVVALPRGL